MVVGKEKIKRMKIIIDARFWSETGIGRYLRNLVTSLEEIDSTNEYYLLFLEKNYHQIKLKDNFHKILFDFPCYGIEEQLNLPKLLSSLKPDLVHFPHFNVPIFYRGKYIVTIHDLIHQHYQTHRLSTHNRLWYGIKKIGYYQVFGHAVRGARKIITPSEFVKKQIATEWLIREDKILVTPEAVEDNFLKIIKRVSSKDFQDLTKKFNFQKPYLF